MAFFEYEFPRKIGQTAQGGAAFSTTLNQGFSGFEHRNRNWAVALHQWTVTVISQQNPTSTAISDLDILRAFHYVVSGQGDGFRFFDATDFSALAQVIGVGDGATTTFQLAKVYTAGNRSYSRTITKPIVGAVGDYTGVALGTDTVVVYDNGAPQTHNPLTYGAGGGVQYTLDYTTGIVTFAAAPAAGHIITADFHFHTPVRFGSDLFGATGGSQFGSSGSGMSIMAKNQNTNTIASVTVDLVEVRI